jgi:hypothetical protein
MEAKDDYDQQDLLSDSASNKLSVEADEGMADLKSKEA